MNHDILTPPKDDANFTNLCDEILHCDKNIHEVVIIDKRGRPFEKKNKTILIHEEKSEMLFMERALEISMGKDFDDDFGKINYTFTERDNIAMFSFPINEFIILVTSKSNTSPISMARKMISIITPYKNFKPSFEIKV